MDEALQAETFETMPINSMISQWRHQVITMYTHQEAKLNSGAGTGIVFQLEGK